MSSNLDEVGVNVALQFKYINTTKYESSKEEGKGRGRQLILT